MWSRIVRRAGGGEDGLAMVTAVLVLSVVTLTTITVVQLSNHNSEQSAFDRNRLQAVNAAEAGLDDYLSGLPTAPDALCSPADVDLPNSPSVHYHRTVLLYSTWPPQDASLIASCPPSVQPLAALVTATGSSVTGSSFAVKRTMETLVQIAPYYGAFNMAIFSDTGLNFVNKLTEFGYKANDADVYTNGDFNVSNNSTISGSIYAQGTATIGNQFTVKQDVWANRAVAISGSASVFGRVRSSTSSITVSNPAHVYGSARAGTTVGGSGKIDGTIISNSPTGPPPSLPIPHLGYNPSDWVGYTINTFSDCTLAKAFIDAMPTANEVVRISPTCALSWANNSTINVRGNLAIITDGSVTFNNHTDWNGVGGNWTVHFIRPWAAGLNCSSGNYDISFSNNTNFNNGLKIGVYTQCTANMANQNGLKGQIFGGTVNVTNQMTFTYAPTLFPGAAQVGYQAAVSYLREVGNP